jgi:hypothetical protein
MGMSLVVCALVGTTTVVVGLGGGGRGSTRAKLFSCHLKVVEPKRLPMDWKQHKPSAAIRQHPGPLATLQVTNEDAEAQCCLRAAKSALQTPCSAGQWHHNYTQLVKHHGSKKNSRVPDDVAKLLLPPVCIVLWIY